MSSPYIGEIRMFAGNFAPAGWALCQGQLVPISENDTLFNLIGTTYGGDGQETFAYPNLCGRVPIHQGTLSGQTFVIGEAGGVESVTLTTQQIPVHSHPILASADAAQVLNPQNNVLAGTASATPYFNIPPVTTINANSVSPVGGSQPHENMQPYLCINFIISLFGIYPTQN